jgi:signal transduction histidine kinase
MAKFSLTIAVALLLYLPVLSQQNDKAISFTSHFKKSDTSQIHLLLKQGKNFENFDPDSSVYYYKKATALAYALKQQQLLLKCMALHMALLNNEAKFEDALTLAQEHIDMSNQLGYSAVQLQAYNEAANEYEYLGDYEPATENYLKSLELAVHTGDKKMERKINNNLASVFIALKDFVTGYNYSMKAYQMAAKDKDTVTMGNCMVNIGIAELHQKKFQQALQHFDEAEKIGYSIPDMTLVADALSDKGLTYLTNHNLNAAKASYTRQKSIAEKYDLPYEKLYALFQLAMIEKERGNFNDANKYASGAIAIGEQLGTADELMEMYDSMAVIRQKLGDYKSAFYYKNKYAVIDDSLRNQSVETNIHHLNIQYRTAQKDKRIAEQNLSIERSKAAIEKKNMWIIASLAGIIALAMILVLSLRSYRHKQNLHHQQLLTLQKQHEVNTLRAKMQAREDERDRIAREMHDDVGSALTTILFLSDDLKTQDKKNSISSADRIAAIASSVVDKMNEIIWSMNPDYDSLNDLIAYTRRHCAEFLRDHNLKYSLDIPLTITDLPLSGEQRRNIYLVIKEALHNIVKHASATEVNIGFGLHNETLHISIRDNGKGLTQSSRFGNGLKNMRTRIENIGGSFEIVHKSGTTVKLKCPLHNSALDP